MCIKAIVIDKSAEELHLRLLAVMFDRCSDRSPRRVRFCDLAKNLGVSEDVVRYNIRKLLRMGYIVSLGPETGYRLTDKVAFLDPELFEESAEET